MERGGRLVAWGAMLSCVAGCGAAPAATGVGRNTGIEFPSRAVLRELAARPPKPEQASDRKTLAVDDWQPAAAPDVATTEAEAWVQAAAAAKGRSIAVDAELSCAAREIALFYTKHQAFPDQQLQAFMAGVCGSTAPTFSVMVWSTPNDTLVDPANQAQWQKTISEQLAQSLPEGSNLSGAAQVSNGSHTAFAAAVATSAVTWEGRPLQAGDNGQVVLSGSVRSPTAFVHGMVNVGAYGVKDCEGDPRVAAPNFRLICQLDGNDSSAWVDIQALPPGRVLARSVARLLLRRPGATLAFSAPSKNAPLETVTDPGAFTQRLFSLVNETRAAAKLPAFALATRQSETSFKLAPHYFDSDGGADLVSDQIALGVLAGWDVKGTIRTGDLYSNTLSGSLDPKRWLGFMLDQPSARRVLLDARARSIAIGTDLRPQSQSVGALVSTYTFYETDDHRADVQSFVTRLNRHRRGLGLAPATLRQDEEVARAVQTVKSNHNPESALNSALELVLAREQRGVEGFYIEANDLAHISYPEALLRPSVTIAVSAAHHRYPDAAWGTLTLLVVLLDSSGPQQMANVAKPRAG